MSELSTVNGASVSDSAIDAFAEDGESAGQIDGSLVAFKLTLSYEKRIEAHESALQLLRALQEAGREYYARKSESST